MASDWRPILLGEACSKIGSGATPRGGSATYSDDGPVALIRSQNVHNHGFEAGGLAFISAEQADRLRAVEVHAGDVLVNITGESVGRVCQAPPSALPARVNQHVAIMRPIDSKLDARFLRYALIGPSMQSQLASLSAGGATRRALTKSMLESLAVHAPSDVAEQREIADILGALDDKIELNQRMGETLEQLARNHFHQVLDASGGRAPLRPLGDILAVIETGRRPKGGIKGITAGIPSVGAESITRIGEFDYSKTRYVPYAFFESMNRGVVEDLDVLLYKDGGKPGVYEPHVSQMGLGFPFDDFCINEHVYRLRVSPPYTQAYLYYWLSSEPAFQEMRVKSSGVAVPGLNSSAVKSLRFPAASHDVVDGFSRLADPVNELILRSANESKLLAQIRDTLLPKLISGEIRIPDAERIVSEVT